MSQLTARAANSVGILVEKNAKRKPTFGRLFVTTFYLDLVNPSRLNRVGRFWRIRFLRVSLWAIVAFLVTLYFGGFAYLLICMLD